MEQEFFEVKNMWVSNTQEIERARMFVVSFRGVNYGLLFYGKLTPNL